MDSEIERLKSGQAIFRIHGPDGDRDGMLSASLFANKLGVLIRALKEADRRANGELRHDYGIAKLQSSSPTVMLKEHNLPRYEGQFHGESGVSAFQICADAVAAGESERVLQYGKCAVYIGQLAKGASKSFGYGEIWTGDEKSVRVDGFLQERTEAITRPETHRPQIDGADWYKGVVDGSFDGAIKVVDLRGNLPEIKLILTAGGKQVDCVCTADEVEAIRANLDRRVRIFGRAIYDGRSGLPRRIEVRQIEPISGGADFTVWKGAFKPFDPPDWDVDGA